MEILTVVPRGEVEITYTWGSGSIDFRDGSFQKHRKRVRANKTMKFVVSGLKKTMDYLINFYNEHRGQLDKFYFEYDGVQEICTFGDKLSITEKREIKGRNHSEVVGFSCEVLLSVDSQSTIYESVGNNFDFIPYREVIEEIDWNTTVLDMGAAGRVKTYSKPRRKYSMKISGTKDTRDRLINLYNIYGDFGKVMLNYGGETIPCLMPESLVITDKRELTKIVGFSCDIDLQECGEPADGTPNEKPPSPDEPEKPLWFWSYNGRHYNGVTSTQFLKIFAVDEDGNVELFVDDNDLPIDLWINQLVAGADHVNLLIAKGSREDSPDNMRYIAYNASEAGQFHGNNTVFQSYGSAFKPTHIDCDSKDFGRRVGSAWKGDFHSFNVCNEIVGYTKTFIGGYLGTYPAFGYLVDPQYNGIMVYPPTVFTQGTTGAAGKPHMMFYKSTVIHFYVYPDERIWGIVKTQEGLFSCLNYLGNAQYHFDSDSIYYLMSDDIFINNKQYNLYQFIHEPFNEINFVYEKKVQTVHNVLSILNEGTPIQKLIGRKLWDSKPIERIGKIKVTCNERIYLYDSSDVPHIFWYDFRDDTCFLPLHITRIGEGKFYAITAERKAGHNPNAKAGSMYDNSNFPNYEVCFTRIEEGNITKLITLDMLEDKFVDPYYEGDYRHGFTPYLAKISNGTTFKRTIKDGVSHVKSGVLRNFN